MLDDESDDEPLDDEPLDEELLDESEDDVAGTDPFERESVR
ncbi:hypothetical protein GCM10023197_02910 [Gordonia humi]